jgi:CheY-like chemotaxis protein
VRHKLLLADDSVTIQRVVELTFSGEDVQVVAVSDGEQAIARIPLERPDIVLADIGMPKRSGYDVAAFVKGRKDLSHIPVLLLAGAFEPVDESRAQQVQSDGVLVKPFEPQQVISRVRMLIASTRQAATPAVRSDKVAAAPGMGLDATAERTPPVDISEPATILESRDRNAESRLDDYFQRLDAAFAQLGSSDIAPATQSKPATHVEAEDPEVPTVESLLASPLSESRGADHERPPVPVELTDLELDTKVTPAPGPVVAPAARAEPGERNLVADMFAALFAVEQGDTIPQPQAFVAQPSKTTAVSDDLVDEVTRRVLERLAPNAVNEMVTRIVSDLAERLIREEIARIKSSAATRL